MVLDARAALKTGLLIALFVAFVDQAFKLWMLFGLGLQESDRIPLVPGFEIVMLWNYGISYGLFQQDTALGQWFLIAFKIVAVAFLIFWLNRTKDRLAAIALGLIIGGAIGNGVDRVAYGAVADFFHFYFGNFSWYVFNLADVAIVAGVALLLYESLLGKGRMADTAGGRPDRGS